MTFKGYHCTRCGRITEDCPSRAFCPRCNGVVILSTEETLSATMGRLHDALAKRAQEATGVVAPEPPPAALVRMEALDGTTTIHSLCESETFTAPWRIAVAPPPNWFLIVNGEDRGCGPVEVEAGGVVQVRCGIAPPQKEPHRA